MATSDDHTATLTGELDFRRMVFYCCSIITIALYKSTVVAEMGDRLATIDMAEKWEGSCCVPFLGGAGSPMSHVSRPTSISSGILIHPTVWPQFANVTDGTDRTDRKMVPQHISDRHL